MTTSTRNPHDHSCDQRCDQHRDEHRDRPHRETTAANLSGHTFTPDTDVS